MSTTNRIPPVKPLPVYFDGSISLKEIEAALHSLGMYLRGDGRGRYFAERVPRYLIKTVDAIDARPSALPAMRMVSGRRT